jgi:hypothetical protein
MCQQADNEAVNVFSRHSQPESVADVCESKCDHEGLAVLWVSIAYFGRF